MSMYAVYLCMFINVYVCVCTQNISQFLWDQGNHSSVARGRSRKSSINRILFYAKGNHQLIYEEGPATCSYVV